MFSHFLFDPIWLYRGERLFVGFFKLIYGVLIRTLFTVTNTELYRLRKVPKFLVHFQLSNCHWRRILSSHHDLSVHFCANSLVHNTEQKLFLIIFSCTFAQIHVEFFNRGMAFSTLSFEPPELLWAQGNVPLPFKWTERFPQFLDACSKHSEE